jgi:hypothetical protein
MIDADALRRGPAQESIESIFARRRAAGLNVTPGVGRVSAPRLATLRRPTSLSPRRPRTAAAFPPTPGELNGEFSSLTRLAQTGRQDRAEPLAKPTRQQHQEEE